MNVVSLYISSERGERKGWGVPDIENHRDPQAAGSKACVGIQELWGVSEQLFMLWIFSCEMDASLVTVRKIPNENTHQ